MSFAVFKGSLGQEAWKAMGALCGSWMGGGGNMLAIQAALNVSEDAMAYALVMDSICGTFYVCFFCGPLDFPINSMPGPKRTPGPLMRLEQL